MPIHALCVTEHLEALEGACHAPRVCVTLQCGGTSGGDETGVDWEVEGEDVPHLLGVLVVRGESPGTVGGVVHGGQLLHSTW